MSAEELKGRQGDDLIDEVLLEQEYKEDVKAEAEKIVKKKKVKKKAKGKMTVIFQAEFVERLLAETLGQLKNQLDTLFLIFHDKETEGRGWKTSKEKMTAIKGTYIILMNELERLEHCLQSHTKYTMNVKHYASKRVSVEAIKRFRDMKEGIDKAKNLNHSSIIKFGEELVLFMTNLHTVLSEQTKPLARKETVNKYCGKE